MVEVGASSIDELLSDAEEAMSNQDYEALAEISNGFYKYDGLNARLYENFYLGIVAKNTYEYEAAKGYFLKSIDLSEELGDSCWLGKSMFKLSITYFYLAEQRKLIDVGDRLVKLDLPCVSKSKVYQSIGAAYRRLGSFDTASQYLTQALDLGKKEEPIVVPFVYNHLSDILAEQGDKLKAIGLRRQMLMWLDTAEYPSHFGLYTSYLSNQARDYVSTDFFDSSLIFYKKGIELAEERNVKYSLPSLYFSHALYWSKKAEYDSANYFYLKAFSASEQSKNYEIRQLALENIQIGWGNKLSMEQLKLEKASLQRNISIIVGITLFLLSFLLIRLSRQKARHQQLMRAKEAEVHRRELESVLAGQEVKVVEALVEGQEHERKRLSQELHDTIGSMLATLKLQFESLTDLFDVSSSKQESKIEFTNDLLDKTCLEVRRISHNLSSGMVSKVGFIAAVRQTAQSINSSGKIEVEFVSEVDDLNLKGDAEVHLFRVVQELLSNAIKHSEATKLSVQINAHENEASIIIEDNGKGFDYDKALKEGKGMGLTNLNTRVSQLNGQLNIDSVAGRGTTAIIELTL